MSDENASLLGAGVEPILQWPERPEVAAKRALLREQTRFLGEELPWLSDPNSIPAEAAQPSGAYDDLYERCFSLATWLLAQIVRAANRVQHKLSWEETFDYYNVPSEIQERVLRAVLEPTSRHAPGIFAMCEIVAAVPEVAIRESVPRSDWGTIARDTEKFGTKISYDGTDLQVLIRDYLRKSPETAKQRYQRVLEPALLRLDDETGLTSITPIDDLISSAKVAVAEHIRPPKGVCVALLAKAPVCEHDFTAPTTMYGAIWSAYAQAADRIIFSNVDLRRLDISPPAEPDVGFAAAFDALARRRAADWKDGYPGKIWRAAKDEIETVLARQEWSNCGRPVPTISLRRGS